MYHRGIRIKPWAVGGMAWWQYENTLHFLEIRVSATRLPAIEMQASINRTQEIGPRQPKAMSGGAHRLARLISRRASRNNSHGSIKQQCASPSMSAKTPRSRRGGRRIIADLGDLPAHQRSQKREPLLLHRAFHISAVKSRTIRAAKERSQLSA